MPLSTSIAVCTYNGERFLQEQLDSLLAQTQLPDQIVIRDDVSSDRTVEILRAFVPSARILGIEVDLQINSRNVGYRRNFDGALRACTGDIIFLCDQDDVWFPSKLNLSCDVFANRPGLLALHSDATLIDEQGRILPDTLFNSLYLTRDEVQEMHRGSGFEIMLKRNLMTGAAMALRRSVLSYALPLPESVWVHDAWIGTLAAMVGEVDSLEKRLIGYRIHRGNQLGLGGNDHRPRNIRRAAQLQNEREQASSLLARAQQFGAHPRLISLVSQKLEHVTTRSSLPRSRLKRIPTVISEYFSGNYGRFGRGALSAAVDLVK